MNIEKKSTKFLLTTICDSKYHSHIIKLSSYSNTKVNDNLESVNETNQGLSVPLKHQNHVIYLTILQSRMTFITLLKQKSVMSGS